MKIEDILNTGNPELYAATATAAREGATSDVLSKEDIRNAVEFMKSKEYAKILEEAHRFLAYGEMILSRAYQEGAISDSEYNVCYFSLALNGALIVPVDIYDKLLPIAEKLGKDGVFKKK